MFRSARTSRARGNQCTTNDIALLARVATHARGNQHTTGHIAASAKWIQKTFHLSNHFALIARITSHARGNQYTTNDMDLLVRVAIHVRGNQHITNDMLRRLNGFKNLFRTGPCSWESTRGPVLVGINTWRSRICSTRTPETFRVATGREAGRQAVLRAAICIVALNLMKQLNEWRQAGRQAGRQFFALQSVLLH